MENKSVKERSNPVGHWVRGNKKQVPKRTVGIKALAPSRWTSSPRKKRRRIFIELHKEDIEPIY